MKGIISFDMDMTLLDHSASRIPDSAYRAIDRLREQYYIAIATGRDLDSKFSAGLRELVEPDAVIQFCHWGCKQSSGGSVLLKEEMQKKGIPMLILDGDGIDKRNSHDGQIKTRLEAFLEMLDAEEKEEEAI